MSNVTKMVDGRIATGADVRVSLGQKNIYNKTFQSTGFTTAGAGAATIAIEGSNDGINWVSLGNVNLTLGTAVTTQSLTYTFPWGYYRANVSALSGTGANVSVYAAF